MILPIVCQTTKVCYGKDQPLTHPNEPDRTTGLMPFISDGFLMNYENVEDDSPSGRDRRGNHTGDWSHRSYA